MQSDKDFFGQIIPFQPRDRCHLHIVRAQVEHSGNLILGPWPQESQLPAVWGSTQPLVREGPEEVRDLLPRFYATFGLRAKFDRTEYGEMVEEILRLVLVRPALYDIDDEPDPHSAFTLFSQENWGEFSKLLEPGLNPLKLAAITRFMEGWDKVDRDAGCSFDRYQFVIDLQALVREEARKACVPMNDEAYRMIGWIVPAFLILCVQPPSDSSFYGAWFTLRSRYVDRFPHHAWGKCKLI